MTRGARQIIGACYVIGFILAMAGVMRLVTAPILERYWGPLPTFSHTQKLVYYVCGVVVMFALHKLIDVVFRVLHNDNPLSFYQWLIKP